MSAIWLEKLSLDRLAAGKVEIDTEIPVTALPRLESAVLPGTSDVAIKMTLQESAKGIVLVDGRIRLELKLACQRCLDAMSVPVDNTVRLALLQREEQEAFLPAGYESLLIVGNEVRVADLVEDEILLELPIAPRHRVQDCGPLNESVQSLKKTTTETNSPFAGLADILRDSH
ncbi:MAG: DUF177 domain-containing protein [Gammaproteobacteria bacterium]|nr:DUF177 domain-containing protein [Gammaproteobacteria bacterium]NNF68105.1 hypothetical protein [Gammaproteobacteria bacterium]